MDERFGRFMSKFRANPPCSLEALGQVQSALAFQLPADYVAFMLQANGGAGGIGENSFLQLWKVEELIDLNHGYAVDKFAPGLILFGSDGGGTAYAFDTRSADVPIAQLPFIPMDLAEVEQIGRSFVEFLESLRRS